MPPARWPPCCSEGVAVSTRSAKFVPPIAALVCALVLLGGAGMVRANGGRPETQNASLAQITVDYPLPGSIFPPDITAPTFLWRDASESTKHWVIEFSFGGHAKNIRMEVAGKPFKWGAVDPETGPTGELLKLTAQQAATRTWAPDAATWAMIKQGPLTPQPRSRSLGLRTMACSNQFRVAAFRFRLPRIQSARQFSTATCR